MVAQSKETILEERPEDLDDDCYSPTLGDHWYWDFDYLSRYDMSLADPIAQAESWLETRREGLSEARGKFYTSRENKAAMVRIWSGYVEEARSELSRVKSLVSSIGLELELPKLDV